MQRRARVDQPHGRPHAAALGHAQSAQQARDGRVQRRLAPEREVDLLRARRRPRPACRPARRRRTPRRRRSRARRRRRRPAAPSRSPRRDRAGARTARNASSRGPGRSTTTVPGSSNPVRYRMSLSCLNLKCVSPLRRCSGGDASSSARARTEAAHQLGAPLGVGGRRGGGNVETGATAMADNSNAYESARPAMRGPTSDLETAVVSGRGAARIGAGHPWVFRPDVVRGPSTTPATAARRSCASRTDAAGRWASPPGPREPRLALRMVARRGPARAGRSAGAGRGAAGRRARAAAGAEPRPRRLARRPRRERLLPGLVVDRYADAAVIQTTSVAMSAARAEIAAVVRERLDARVVVCRDDGSARDFEELPRFAGVVAGGGDARVVYRLGRNRLETDLLRDGKTGGFLDQADNHAAVAALAPPGRARAGRLHAPRRLRAGARPRRRRRAGDRRGRGRRGARGRERAPQRARQHARRARQRVRPAARVRGARRALRRRGAGSARAGQARRPARAGHRRARLQGAGAARRASDPRRAGCWSPARARAA